MDKAYPPEAWKRLGKVLEARRGELGYGFRQREAFLLARGGPPPSMKMLARLERGERTAYPPATITSLESLYGYAPGSFEAVLAGGEPVPLNGAHLSAVPPQPPLHAPGDEYGEVLTLLFGDDEPPSEEMWRLLVKIWRLRQPDKLTLLRVALLSRVPRAQEPPSPQERRGGSASLRRR